MRWLDEREVNWLHRCIVRLALGSDQCPPSWSDNCQGWSRGHHGPETVPSRPAGCSPLLLVGVWLGCSSLPVGLRARDQSQTRLITSINSWSLHPCNSESNLGFALCHGVSLWPWDIITMSLLVIQFKVSEIVEGDVAIKKQCFYSTDWTDVLHTQRCAGRAQQVLKSTESAAVALEAWRRWREPNVVLSQPHCPLEVVPGGNYLLTSSNTCTIICCCLCHTSLLLSLSLQTLPPSLLPWLCRSLQWARQQQTRRHVADTQGFLQVSLQLCELSPRAGLAGQYKPDIRFVLLALRVTAGFASSLKLLAAVGELLARVKLG